MSISVYVHLSEIGGDKKHNEEARGVLTSLFKPRPLEPTRIQARATVSNYRVPAAVLFPGAAGAQNCFRRQLTAMFPDKTLS